MSRVSVTKEVRTDFVYGIYDSRTHECRYVGRSHEPQRRFAYGHCWSAFKTSQQSPLYSWMRKHGLENISMEVLEECSSFQEGLVSEMKWIETLSSTNSLLNQTIGGEYFELTEEGRQRHRLSLIGNKNATGSRDEIFKKRMSEIQKGRVLTSTHRENIRKGMLGKRDSRLDFICNCGQSFKRYPSEIKGRTKLFCSQVCKKVG